MSELIEHRGYYGSVHFDADDLIFHGKIEFIRALVSYEATDAKGLKQVFEEAVDDYLETCERNKIEPEKPFKGNFNIRVKPELHRRLAIAAINLDIKLNRFIADTLEKALVKSEQTDKDKELGHAKTTLKKEKHQPALVVHRSIARRHVKMARKASKSSRDEHQGR